MKPVIFHGRYGDCEFSFEMSRTETLSSLKRSLTSYVPVADLNVSHVRGSGTIKEYDPIDLDSRLTIGQKFSSYDQVTLSFERPFAAVNPPQAVSGTTPPGVRQSMRAVKSKQMAPARLNGFVAGNEPAGIRAVPWKGNLIWSFWDFIVGKPYPPLPDNIVNPKVLPVNQNSLDLKLDWPSRIAAPGTVGFINTGNSCYLNAGLQW